MTTAKPSMQSTMRRVHEVLRGRDDPGAAAVALNIQEDRLRAYQGYIRSHIDAVVLKNYTTLAALLGQDVWNQILDGYFLRHPADDYEVNASVRYFVEYVAELADKRRFGLTGLHAELAEFERHEFEVYAAPIEVPAPDASGTPQLNPTTVILQFEYAVGSFVQNFRRAEAQQDSLPQAPTEPAPETVFVMRHPETLRHIFLVADDSLLFAFKMAHDQISPGVAALETGLPIDEVRETLHRAAVEGLIVFSPQ